MFKVDTSSKYFPGQNQDDESGHAHRQLIGFTGLLLPLLLWLIAGLRPVDGLPQWEPLSSVSAYYYSGAVSIFAGVLVALAIFLFTYRGYDNKYQRRDRIAAVIGGIAAVLVAYFPTDPPAGVSAPAWWTESMGSAHYYAAIVLFGAFVFFSLFQFPIRQNEADFEKRVRNTIYLICGAGIIGSLVWAVVAIMNKAPIFWPETFALLFFAVSWLVKGRVDKTITAAGRQAAQSMSGQGSAANK